MDALLGRDDPGRRWLLALLLTLLWHGLVFVSLQRFDPFAPGALRRPDPRPVELVFERPPPAADPANPTPETSEPEFFSELPEDRADVPADHPDFLSNVDSRAADRQLGEEETALPHMQGRGDSPQVAMQPSPAGEEESGSPAGEAVQPARPAAPAREEEEGGSSAAAGETGSAADIGQRLERSARGEFEQSRSPSTEDPAADPREELLRKGRPRARPLAEPRYLVGVDRQDLFQEEMNNPLGNVNLFADLSLNTVAWDWAPWVQRFSRQFHRNWVPPYAYLLGIIDGYEMVDLEVAPDGHIVHLDVLEEEGHESLRESTLATFRSFAPYHPLPEDFPEPTLKLRIRVVYPALR